MPPIQMIRYYCSGIRDSFMMEEDMYKDWVLLAPQSGGFSYNLSTSAEDDFQEVSVGELVICPPGTLLKRKVTSPLSFIFIEFSSERTYFHGKIMIRDIQRLTSTFTYLRHLSDEPSDKNRAYANHLIADLLFQIEKEQDHMPSYQQDKTDPITYRALAYIEQHAFGTHFQLQDLAKELGLSASQLTRRFQQVYKLSPIAYATTLRLQKVRSLLVDTDLTLEDIAEQCGYQNAFYMSRMFKSKIKISPSTYRRTYRF
ncbi:helix-turn-helix domain-containing protein [Paenibacillus qinlingensis]|uniref:helix-turn-helix domain-containing protein n=1 Tax=Paenibacillus qinlingensis TaxID=1837343 RepID=UPI001565BDFC|nr:AraC family transcriptional regulator [Paenibacillus qinlingensis]NQX61288.1 helix-turn-helix transcriptional regulator [Paenibacillus qinlingensis]